VALGLFFVMLVVLEVGRRYGLRRQAADAAGAKIGTAAVEGSVFALLGLLVAFTFNSAADRFDARRRLILEEANAVGTAWLRLDLLPAEDQTALRNLFRDYLDSRLRTYKHLPDFAAARREVKESARLQAHIWDRAKAAALRDARPQVATLVLPALNEMFDISTARLAALKTHLPGLILVSLMVVAVFSALLAGYSMTSRKTRNWLHMVLFAGIISLAVYVILDLEYPRAGLIQLEAADEVLLDLRQSLE
jgi:hypothetical protein